jgi:hypothetical protein
MNESIFALMVMYAMPRPPGANVVSKTGSGRFSSQIFDAKTGST